MAHKFGLLVLIFLTGLLAACRQNEVVEDVVLITKTAVSPTTISPITTPTRTPSATATTRPTKTPSATATTIPTKTPTRTPAATATATTIPTLTPLPTFAPEELETAVSDLLANPMNCDVPCWWSAIPGETTFFEIQQLLELHQLTEYMRHVEQIPDDRFSLWMGFDENENRYDFRIRYGFKDTVLTSLVSEKAPPLSYILKKHGQPDEAWFETMSYEREGNLSVRLNLVYLQDGMAVGYVVDGQIQDEIVTGCFADKKTGHLHLLAPNTATSYKDFTIFSRERHYLPLEKATNLTMADFMQQFSDPTQPQCLETPTELWK